MEAPTDDAAAFPVELALDRGTGVWACHGASAAVYVVDLDQRRLLRVPGDGSPRGGWDGCWVPLATVTSEHGLDGVVRVGDRHRWVTSPDGADGPRVWVQRVVRLEPVPAEQVPTGRTPDADEAWQVFGPQRWDAADWPPED